jgi:hypothetical protein
MFLKIKERLVKIKERLERFFDAKLGWHVPIEETIHADPFGFQFSATCKYCGKHIIQDSQGN